MHTRRCSSATVLTCPVLHTLAVSLAVLFKTIIEQSNRRSWNQAVAGYGPQAPKRRHWLNGAWGARFKSAGQTAGEIRRNSAKDPERSPGAPHAPPWQRAGDKTRWWRLHALEHIVVIRLHRVLLSLVVIGLTLQWPQRRYLHCSACCRGRGDDGEAQQQRCRLMFGRLTGVLKPLRRRTRWG
jgi:hypothetical protein